MILGFTGTRKGMTEFQIEELVKFLNSLDMDIEEAHHGDCIGSDAQFHEIMGEMKVPRIVHPPVDSKFRAFCKGETILPEKEYKERDRDIVEASDLVIGTPSEKPNPRSGTLYTLRYAKKTGVKTKEFLARVVE